MAKIRNPPTEYAAARPKPKGKQTRFAAGGQAKRKGDASKAAPRGADIQANSKAKRKTPKRSNASKRTGPSKISMAFLQGRVKAAPGPAVKYDDANENGSRSPY